MQKIILVLCLCSLFACSSTQTVEKNDWTKENLVGKVKKYIEHQYKPLAENSTETPAPEKAKENLGLRQKSIRNYNQQGYIEEIIFSARGGKISSRRLYEYDENSNIIKNHHFVAGDSIPMITNELSYDNNNEIKEVLYFDRGKLKTKTVFETNSTEGTKIGKVSNVEGTVFSEIKSTLDADGKVLSEAKFDREGQSMSFIIHNKYDKAGNLRVEEHYQPVGNTFTITQSNEKGQEYHLMKYREGVLTAECTYEYDEKGNQAHSICDLYENQVKRTVESNLKYVYDKEGNWIRKETLQEGKVTYVIEREYVYY